MSVSFRFTFILLTGFMLSENIFSTTVSVDGTAISGLLKQSSIYLSHSNFDSAGICIENARNAGMSKDSLFYLFSELYVQKSIFDTALAFNYSIIATKNDSMYSKKFEQRYLIYSMLNLKSEADKAMDSLGLFTGKRGLNSYIPHFSVLLNSAYTNGKTYTPALDPGDNQFMMQSLPIKGYSGDLSCSMDWDLPWPEERLFTIGTEYTSNKASDQKVFKKDSLAQSWSMYLQINNFHRYNLSYNFSRNKNQQNVYSSSNKFELSWRKMDADFKRTLRMSLTGEFLIVHSEIYYQIYSFDSYIEKKIINDASMRFNLSIYSLIMKKEVLTHTAKVINITNAKDPVFLTTSLDTIKKPISQSEKLYFPDSIEAKSIVTNLLLIQNPNTTVNIAPSIVNSFYFFLKTTCITSIGWTFTYYPEYYEWKVPQEMDTIIVRDNEDGKLYNLNNFRSMNEGIKISPIYEYKKRRIDNTLIFSISVRHAVWKFGDFAIGGTIQKTYSTLSTNSPIEIPDWTWDISSSLIINFPFRK